jgi:hypothetical protein
MDSSRARSGAEEHPSLTTPVRAESVGVVKYTPVTETKKCPSAPEATALPPLP